MLQAKAKILGNKKITADFYKISIRAPHIARTALPGQFLNIKVADTYTPLLRKPLGINRIWDGRKNGQVDLLYKVVGQGTQILSSRKKNEYLDILGPLGNGFHFTQYAIRNTQYALIGGGIGVSPLLFLAQYLILNLHIPSSNIIVFIGASTKRHILCSKDFRSLSIRPRIATEDGSKGFKGTITELLEHILVTGHRLPFDCTQDRQVRGQKLPACDLRHVTIYACGPKPMLMRAAEISKKFQIPCFGLLEEYMACGTGVCFGCVVSTITGFKRVCKDGPVFDLSTIRW